VADDRGRVHRRALAQRCAGQQRSPASHTYRTWLGEGHTIPTGDPPRPLHDGSHFTGFVIGAPDSLPEDDDVARTAAGKEIHIYAVYPLYSDELDFKLERGWGELADRLGAADVSDIVDPERPSVAGKKKKRR
jgi:hypothetical protein